MQFAMSSIFLRLSSTGTPGLLGNAREVAKVVRLQIGALTEGISFFLHALSSNGDAVITLSFSITVKIVTKKNSGLRKCHGPDKKRAEGIQSYAPEIIYKAQKLQEFDISTQLS